MKISGDVIKFAKNTRMILSKLISDKVEMKINQCLRLYLKIEISWLLFLNYRFFTKIN